MKPKFLLGLKLRDLMTGFEGIAMSRVEYLNGCVQYCLKPEVDPQKMHERPDGYYIDQDQLVEADNVFLKRYEAEQSKSRQAGHIDRGPIGGASHREGDLPT